MKQDYYFQPWLQKHPRTMHSPTLPLVSTGIKQSPITRARSLRQSRVKKKKKNFYSTRRVFHLRSGPPPSLRPPIKRNSNATTPLAIPTLLETPEFARRSFLFFFFFHSQPFAKLHTSGLINPLSPPPPLPIAACIVSIPR